MKQKNKSTHVKRKEPSIRPGQVTELQQRKPEKKYAAQPQPGKVTPGESTLMNEQNAASINPNSVTRS